MTYHSNDRDNELLEIVLAGVRASSFMSSADGMMLTAVRCNGCARIYHELLTTAEAKVVSGQPMLCIRCDTVEGEKRSGRITLAGIFIAST